MMRYRKMALIAVIANLAWLAGFENMQVWADDAVQCERLYQSKQYEAAFSHCERAAELGNARAQFNLAAMFTSGEVVKLDGAKATKWFRKAATQGLADAQYILGLSYENGQGVMQDYAEAVKWYRKAARREMQLLSLGLA